MDFTYKPIQKVIVRFNNEMVMELTLNMVNMTISGTVTDENNDTVYLFNSTVQEGD